MKHIIIFLFFCLYMCNLDAESPEFTQIQDGITSISSALNSLLVETSKKDQLTKLYENHVGEMTFENADGSSIANEIASNIGSILDKKMNSLKKSVQFAEELASNYEWNGELKLDEVEKEVVFAKRLNNTAPGYEYSEQFMQRVDMNFSSVHIPVEIYEGNIDILNGLKWTEGLDEIWAQNKEEDPELIWQYFGSETGIMRIHPASKWNNEGVDLFDVRRRPWYTQGASSPKDMLILVDTSGSTYGQALALMKQSVRSLIDTLGENDFVNVAYFSDAAHMVACFDEFVQANHWNKQILYEAVDNLKAHGRANYHAGFEFAFKQFLKHNHSTNEDNVGAACNQVIMFLTDGGTDEPEELFKKYNPDKRIRIFSYAVGPTVGVSLVKSPKWIACSNRGYFYKIPAMGAIRSAVQKVEDVVLKPLALAGNLYKPKIGAIYHDASATYDVLQRPLSMTSPIRKPILTLSYTDYYDYLPLLSKGFAGLRTDDLDWTNSYQDIMAYLTALAHPVAMSGQKNPLWTNTYVDNTGLGMMTTVTLPVYNSSELSNQTILGVMGSDVTVQELEDTVPHDKLGNSGYAFAINANGYIVFHPNLQAVKGYLNNPPNVDFLEVEVETPEKEELRKRMIDLETGTTTISSYYVHDDMQHVDTLTRVYHFTKIPSSAFSIGVVLPPDMSNYLSDVGATDTADGVEALEEGSTGVLVANMNICSDMPSADNETTALEILIDTITNSPENCDEEKLKRLFFDARVTKGIEDHWTGDLDAEAVFVSTEGGLTRVYPASYKEHLKSKKNVPNEVFYKRALWNADAWIYSADSDYDIYSFNTTPPLIMAAHALKLDSEQYEPAVVGVLLSADTLRENIIGRIDACTPDVSCYVLDDAGFLMVSSDPYHDEHIGRPFEDIDHRAMHALWKSDVYAQNEMYDFQATCQLPSRFTSAGHRSVVPPFLFEILSINWWSSKVMWAYMNFNLMSWLGDLYGAFNPAVQAQSPEDEILGNKSCINHMAQYTYSEGANIQEETIMCANCSRQVTSARIPGSNLMLVLVNGDCTESKCHAPQILREPIVDVPNPSFADGMCNVTARYRRRPDGCYDYNANEDTSDCGGSANIVISLPLLISCWLVSITIATAKLHHNNA